MANSRYEYVKDYEIHDMCLPSTFIVIRIDGKGFTKFTRAHGFAKPNDTNGLNLMNAAACAVMREFVGEIMLGFGQSDEYSFVFRRDTVLYKRRMSKLLSLVVSCFSGSYACLWPKYFPEVELKWIPVFDGRCVLYPSAKLLRDYLAWRQVDVHVNCQYNTCYWMLYEEEMAKLDGDSGHGGGVAAAGGDDRGDGLQTGGDERAAGIGKRVQGMLRGTMTSDKNEIMFQRGVNYNDLPQMWRKGSVLVWEEEGEGEGERERGGEMRASGEETEGEGVKHGKKKDKKQKKSQIKSKRVLRVLHEDIIKDRFWVRHPWLLE